MANASPESISATTLARRLGAALRERGWRLGAAESCTGGGLGWVVTSIPGSSDWFERGFVTYSNAAKYEMLGVAPELLMRHGAVSGQTVRAMARGVLARSSARLAIAISGIAGPGGAMPGKPVGTVWIAWGVAGGAVQAKRFRFKGSRDSVRRQAVHAALAGALKRVAGGRR